jgi:hypothetical protein
MMRFNLLAICICFLNSFCWIFGVGIIFAKDKYMSMMCNVMFQHLDTCPGGVFSRLLGARSIYGTHTFILGVQGIHFCLESHVDYVPDYARLLQES